VNLLSEKLSDIYVRNDLFLLVSDNNGDIVVLSTSIRHFGCSPCTERILVPCPAAKITAFITPPSPCLLWGSLLRTVKRTYD
jgi:hypothetical protein